MANIQIKSFRVLVKWAMSNSQKKEEAVEYEGSFKFRLRTFGNADTTLKWIFLQKLQVKFNKSSFNSEIKC